MPKTKPKVPKTEKMWMGWTREDGFMPSMWSSHKSDCPGRDPRPVRIMTEAEYQRLKAIEKDYERLTSL